MSGRQPCLKTKYYIYNKSWPDGQFFFLYHHILSKKLQKILKIIIFIIG